MSNIPQAILMRRTTDTGQVFTDFMSAADFVTWLLTQMPTGGAPGAPNPRTLALGTAYRALDPTRASRLTINLNSSAALSLVTGATNSADIVIDPGNGIGSAGGTVVASYINSLAGSLVVGLNINTQAAYSVTLELPAGWYFAIRQTAGTVQIASIIDQTIG